MQNKTLKIILHTFFRRSHKTLKNILFLDIVTVQAEEVKSKETYDFHMTVTPSILSISCKI